MLLIIIFSFYLSIYNPFCYYFRSVLWCKDTNYYVIIGKEIAMVYPICYKQIRYNNHLTLKNQVYRSSLSLHQNLCFVW